MTTALMAVAKRHPEWDFGSEGRDAWVDVCATRLRKMCRHIAQAEIHSPRASWLRHLHVDENEEVDKEKAVVEKEVIAIACPSSSEAPVEQDAVEAAVVEPTVAAGSCAPAEYYVGWDSMHQMAWRAKASDKTPMKEFAHRIDVRTEDEDDEPVRAHWKDGFEATIN
eukprot:10803269-Lingulodinium_polyedra.AAC.1